MNKINLSEKWKNWMLKNMTEQDYGQIPDVRIHNEGKGFGECKEKTATGNGNRL